MEAILSLDHIYYSYHDKNGEIPVINDLSFEIKPGSFTSIVGPSGCGKSTLRQKVIKTPGWDICCKRIISLNGAAFIKMLC